MYVSDYTHTFQAHQCSSHCALTTSLCSAPAHSPLSWRSHRCFPPQAASQPEHDRSVPRCKVVSHHSAQRLCRGVYVSDYTHTSQAHQYSSHCALTTPLYSAPAHSPFSWRSHRRFGPQAASPSQHDRCMLRCEVVSNRPTHRLCRGVYVSDYTHFPGAPILQPLRSHHIIVLRPCTLTFFLACTSAFRSTSSVATST